MTLSPEDIDRLLKLELASNRRKPGGGVSGRGKRIDTSVRSVSTWFSLAHKLFDQETGGRMQCENPACVDPRVKTTRGTITAKVEGQFMCRYCFLDGWLTKNPDQSKLEIGNA